MDAATVADTQFDADMKKTAIINGVGNDIDEIRVKIKIEPMDSSQMLRLVGDFGRYQILLMALFAIINVLSAAHYYSQTIISITPEHRCDVPELRNFSGDSPEVRDYLSQLSDPQCTKLVRRAENNRHGDGTAAENNRYLDEGQTEGPLLGEENMARTRLRAGHESSVAPCREGWVYTYDYGYRSMIAELSWVCEDSWRPVGGQSAFFLGSAVGTLAFGLLADRKGRLPALAWANVAAAVGSAVTPLVALVPTAARTTAIVDANSTTTTDALYGADASGAATLATVVFAVSRFVSGLATDSNFVMMYILVMEYLGPARRTLGLNLTIGVFYCLGAAGAPWLAVLLGDWKTFLIVTAAPLLLVPGYGCIVQESCEWLLSRGRVDAALVRYRRIAKINRRELPDWAVRGFRDRYRRDDGNTTSTGATNGGNRRQMSPPPATAAGGGDNSNRTSSSSKAVDVVVAANENVFGLLRTPRLRRNMCILLFKSMVLTLCYDAISRNVDGLGYPPFVVFSASAAAILPACGLLLLVQDRVGRKATACGALLLSGAFTAASGALLAWAGLGEGRAWIAVLLAVVGRLWVTVAYNSGAQYAAELVPTVVRAQGVAVMHVAGYAAATGSIYILYSGHVLFAAFPSLLLGTLSVACGLLCLFLPETLGRPLPATLQEGEDFGRGERPLDFACWSMTSSGSAGKRTRDPAGAQDANPPVNATNRRDVIISTIGQQTAKQDRMDLTKTQSDMTRRHANENNEHHF